MDEGIEFGYVVWFGKWLKISTVFFAEATIKSAFWVFNYLKIQVGI